MVIATDGCVCRSSNQVYLSGACERTVAVGSSLNFSFLPIVKNPLPRIPSVSSPAELV